MILTENDVYKVEHDLIRKTGEWSMIESEPGLLGYYIEGVLDTIDAILDLLTEPTIASNE